MVQIVHDPRREELAERNLTKRGVNASSLQIPYVDQRAKRLDIRSPYRREASQEIIERPAFETSESRLSIDGIENTIRAVLEDDPRPIDPVAFFDVGEVPDDLIRRPRVRPLVARRPVLGQIREDRPKRIRSFAEHFLAELK